jgi:predicted nucleotidyltransferase
MRLTPFEISSIKQAFTEVFGEGEIYLFGSRVDDTKRGGDIDLYIDSASTQELSRKKIDFLVQLKNAIGEQKIDVVINRNEKRLIDEIAKKGVLLCQN